MNYAEDRLDRRARYCNHDGESSLLAEYNEALQILSGVCAASSAENQLRNLMRGHEILGRTLRDCGRCRHATYHFGMAWVYASCANVGQKDHEMMNHAEMGTAKEYAPVRDNDDARMFLAKAAGDYAQMCDLAGFPFIGAIAIFFHQTEEKLDNLERIDYSYVDTQRDSTMFLCQRYLSEGDCGCRQKGCGQHSCFIPFSLEQIDPILFSFEVYLQHLEERKKMKKYIPSSDSILSMIGNRNAKFEYNGGNDHSWRLLQFWNSVRATDQPWEVVLLLLQVKLLYLTVPALAAEAVVHLNFSNKMRASLAKDFKSHWAYYVLIRAVVLGERVKPHRRAFPNAMLHTSVWDILWGTDRENNKNPCLCNDVAELECVDRTPFLNDCQSMRWYVHSFYADQTSNLPCVDKLWLPSDCSFLEQRANPLPLVVVGDSHILSIAWQKIRVPSVSRVDSDNRTAEITCRPKTAIPVLVTGLKAWHTRSGTTFFTNTLLHSQLARLPKWCRTILLSAGEIDCREGIGGELLEGYSHNCADQIRCTVRDYVTSLRSLALQYTLQILVMPVAPHAHRSDKNGKRHGRAVRRESMALWNDELRQELKKSAGLQVASPLILREKIDKVFLLDYERDLLTTGKDYVLKNVFNADYTHMNSAFLPCLERAVRDSGCDLSLL